MFGKKKEAKKQNKQTDDFLLEVIQPQGGITFQQDRLILTGSGYETCLHVYEMPGEIQEHWLGNVCNIKGVVTTVDISTEDQIGVKKNLNRSIQEQEARFRSAQTPGERIDAEKRYQEMEQLLRELDSMEETIKVIHIRIFVYARTLEELEEKVKQISANLESDRYRVATFLSEEKQEWQSVWRSYHRQMEEPLQMYGLPLPSSALAGGNPFHFSCLEDRYGDYLGDTPCGGNVLFSPFTKTEKRTYYNGLVVGEMGSGKSTLLKKIFLSRAVRGDYIRTFDIVGDFTQLTYELGGRVLKLNGKDGILNPLEILASGENEGINFNAAISKAATIYRFLVPEASSVQLTEFQNNLREVYEKFGLAPDPRNPEKKITGRPATEYPIFSDLYRHVTEKMQVLQKGTYNELEQEVVKNRLLRLAEIEAILEKIVNTYGSMLDGHTSIDNILDEQIVTFNIADLKKMDTELFDALTFNMLSLCWDNCVTNGAEMKRRWEMGEVAWEDVVRFLIIIDESHNWINVHKLQAVQLITMYQREARKFFGGLLFASQSIRDYAPEGTNNEKLEKLKDLFEFTQYKFIFRQNSSAVPLIGKLFGEELTDTQKSGIPRQSQGETLLTISGDQTIKLKVYLSDTEAQIFSGGA